MCLFLLDKLIIMGLSLILNLRIKSTKIWNFKSNTRFGDSPIINQI